MLYFLRTAYSFHVKFCRYLFMKFLRIPQFFLIKFCRNVVSTTQRDNSFGALLLYYFLVIKFFGGRSGINVTINTLTKFFHGRSTSNWSHYVICGTHFRLSSSIFSETYNHFLSKLVLCYLYYSESNLNKNCQSISTLYQLSALDFIWALFMTTT